MSTPTIDPTAIDAFVSWLLPDQVLTEAAEVHDLTMDDAPLGIAVVDASARRYRHVILGDDPAAFRSELVATLSTGRWAYLNTVLMRVDENTKRGRRDEVVRRLALCLDLDVRPDTGENCHAKGDYLPTLAQAREYVEHLRADLGLRPWVNHTGGGLHAWVCGQLGFDTRLGAILAEVLAADLAAWGVAHGWQADISPTLSPTLMLRPTGCLREKADGAFVVTRVDTDADRDNDNLQSLFDLMRSTTSDERRPVIDRMSAWVAAVRAEERDAEAQGRDPQYVPVPDERPVTMRARSVDAARSAARTTKMSDGFEVTRGMAAARLLDPARILTEVCGWTQTGEALGRPGSRTGRSGVVFAGDGGYDIVYLWSDGSRAEFGCPVQDAASIIRYLCGGSMRHAEGVYRLVDVRDGVVVNADDVVGFLREYGSHPVRLRTAVEASGLLRAVA